MNNLILVLKGFVMGIANIIPGVSGGTLALTLGIYERFIGALSHFFSNLKENVRFLIPIAIGMVIAILSMSRVISYSYDHFPLPTSLFFVGLVIGGIPMLYNRIKGKKEKKELSSWIILILSFALVLSLAFSEQLFDLDISVSFTNMNITGYLLLLLVGVITAATMIIPGVSGSLVLMLLGYYYPVLNVIKDLTKFKNIGANLLIAGFFGIGVLLGIVLISKLIEYLFEKYEVKTFYGVMGFILASVIAIPVSTYNNVENLIINIPQVIIGIIVLAIGYIIGNKLGEK